RRGDAHQLPPASSQPAAAGLRLLGQEPHAVRVPPRRRAALSLLLVRRLHVGGVRKGYRLSAPLTRQRRDVLTRKLALPPVAADRDGLGRQAMVDICLATLCPSISMTSTAAMHDWWGRRP